MKTNSITRRNFIQKTAVGSGLATLAPLGMAGKMFSGKAAEEKLPREVWIAGVSQMDLHAETSDLMVDKIFAILQQISPYKPDFVCLPELFPFTNVEKETTPAERVTISERVLDRFAEYSKQNNCYTVCPVHIQRAGKFYNGAVVLDRSGKRIGSYEKMHLPEAELNYGYSCGPLHQPVIKTEYGAIGIQICFDMEWDEGWSMLRQQGAKIIFWPSAFAGGKCVNTKAWEHKCVVATASNKNTSKLCDISGEVVTRTGIWNLNFYCAPVNLEKEFLLTWPAVLKFSEIQKKYGRKVLITNFDEEEWSIIESLSPEIYVKDILKEFGLKTCEELMSDVEIRQKKSRG